MAKLTTLDAVRMNRADADAIVAAGELVDLRFVSGNTLSLRAAKLFCLLIQEAGVAVADQVQHRVPYSVLNERVQSNLMTGRGSKAMTSSATTSERSSQASRAR